MTSLALRAFALHGQMERRGITQLSLADCEAIVAAVDEALAAAERKVADAYPEPNGPWRTKEQPE